MTFFGFAVSDRMFSGDITVTRREVTPAVAKEIIRDCTEDESLSVCLNPSHKPTIEALKTRYNITVPIPENAPLASLEKGDSLLLMTVSGLPRLDATRHEYTEEEITSANFSFSIWHVE